MNRPKPVRKGPTPGVWIFDEGDRGYPDTRMEPGDPGYAPHIYASAPEGFEDDEKYQPKIAEVYGDPSLMVERDPEDPNDDGLLPWGDYKYNGKLMAASPEMWGLLKDIIKAWYNRGQAPGTVVHLNSVLFRAEDFIREFEKELEKR